MHPILSSFSASSSSSSSSFFPTLSIHQCPLKLPLHPLRCPPLFPTPVTSPSKLPPFLSLNTPLPPLDPFPLDIVGGPSPCHRVFRRPSGARSGMASAQSQSHCHNHHSNSNHSNGRHDDHDDGWLRRSHTRWPPSPHRHIILPRFTNPWAWRVVQWRGGQYGWGWG